MNPDTGQFVKDVQSLTAFPNTPDHRPPETWVRFGIDEVIVVKGVKMRISRINRGSIVLQPVVGERQSDPFGRSLSVKVEG